MAGRRPQRIRPAKVARSTNLKDPTTSRAVDEVRDAVQVLQKQPSSQVVKQDLKVGTNAVQHGLGRAPAHVSVKPTVADASFAWAENSTNPHRDRQVLIDVVGVAQPGASISLS